MARYLNIHVEVFIDNQWQLVKLLTNNKGENKNIILLNGVYYLIYDIFNGEQLYDYKPLNVTNLPENLGSELKIKYEKEKEFSYNHGCVTLETLIAYQNALYLEKELKDSKKLNNYLESLIQPKFKKEDEFEEDDDITWNHTVLDNLIYVITLMYENYTYNTNDVRIIYWFN